MVRGSTALSKASSWNFALRRPFPMPFVSTNAAAASENNAAATQTSSAELFSAAASSFRTFGVHISQANASTLAGLPLEVEANAIWAATRIIDNPPAQPTPCKSVWSTSDRKPSFSCTRRL